jgi:NitT/TauT family transport system permease protein
MIRFSREPFYASLLLLGVLLLWEALSRVVHSSFFPGVGEVLGSLWSLLTKGDVERIRLHEHALHSLLRVLGGFSLACLTAIPLGILMGLREGTYRLSKPVLEPVRFIPPLAWIPLVILLLSGYWRYLFVIWLGAFFPILLNTISGIKRTNLTLVEVSKSFGANNRTTVRKVVIPSALPEITSGMRVGLGVGWMCIVAAEMIGGERVGLGRLILKYSELLRVDMVVAGMITIGVVGLLMNEVLLRTEKRLFVWRKEVSL